MGMKEKIMAESGMASLLTLLPAVRAEAYRTTLWSARAGVDPSEVLNALAAFEIAVEKLEIELDKL